MTSLAYSFWQLRKEAAVNHRHDAIIIINDNADDDDDMHWPANERDMNF